VLASVCDGDGQCERDVDCNLPGNDYPHIECVGFGVCDQASGSCGWKCGNPQCLDLSGYNFGPCDAVLGVVVLDGQDDDEDQDDEEDGRPRRGSGTAGDEAADGLPLS
jgi:hypothetical protein